MSSKVQKDSLHKSLWEIAKIARGKISGSELQNHIFCTLFYRYLSENFARFASSDRKQSWYEDLDLSAYTEEQLKVIKTQCIEGDKQRGTKGIGYFIPPEDLFCNVVKRADKDDNLAATLNSIFSRIEGTTLGTESEDDLKGLFEGFQIRDSVLGVELKDKNATVKQLLNTINDLPFDKYEDSDIDIFGDTYEYLLAIYSSEAKKGGEFFTPQSISKLTARLALLGNDKLNYRAYDPACGSGSLLLRLRKEIDLIHKKNKDNQQVGLKLYGQELNPITFNLCRMNMILHNIHYTDFKIKGGEDTLLSPNSEISKEIVENLSIGGFDIVVSNPPYSLDWDNETDKERLLSDPRFKPAGVLAPKSAADFAFVMHSLYYLNSTGKAAIVCFPGILNRDNSAEKQIRKYLVENNYVEGVVALSAGLFNNTGTAVNILVLNKDNKRKNADKVVFIDATSPSFYQSSNIATEIPNDKVEELVKIYSNQKNIEFVSSLVSKEEIAKKEYNLSVSSYVTPASNREKIDIIALNKQIKETVSRIEELRKEVDQVIAGLVEDAK